MRFLALTCIGLCLAAATPALAEPTRALPVDEAAEVPSFAAWRDALLDAVSRRDTEAVVAMASPDIRLSFGDDGGRDTLRQWLDGVEDAPWTGQVYWRELEEALSLGGTWQDWGDDRRHFCGPYTFTAELPVDLDAFDAAFVIAPEAPLHRQPDAHSEVVAVLDYDILRVLDWGFDPEHPDGPAWLPVETPDGAHHGHIQARLVRSPVDYRACFSETGDGSWSWELFVAGD